MKEFAPMLANKVQDSTDLENEFKLVADKLAALLASAGVTNRPYREGMPFFKALPLERKTSAIQHIRFYYDLCAEQVQEGKALRDSQTFTWRALKKCGLTPQSDFLSHVSAGDIVEFYNRDNLQLFRNLEFFEFCSYTLEELYCCEWWKLYRRSERITNILLNCVEEVFSGDFPTGMHYPVPQHELHEVASAEMYRVAFDVKFVGPLYTNRFIRGFIAVEKARFLKPGEGLDH